jgi:hypothetical protein
MMKFVLMDATGAHDEEDQYNEWTKKNSLQKLFSYNKIWMFIMEKDC